MSIRQVVIGQTGHKLVTAGVLDDDDTTWRSDVPVMGWALRVTSFADGTEYADIIALVQCSHDAGVGRLVPADDDDENTPLLLLSPNPTDEELARAEKAVAEHVAKERQNTQADKRARAELKTYLRGLPPGVALDESVVRNTVITAGVQCTKNQMKGWVSRAHGWLKRNGQAA